MNTPATRETIQKLSRILREASRMPQFKFKVNNVVVAPARFQRVVSAINRGTIRVVMTDKVGNYSAGYVLEEKTIYILKEYQAKLTLDNKVDALMVHEATHVANHLHKIGKTAMSDDEAAGYIAQMFYYESVSNPWVRRAWKGLKKSRRKIFEEATNAAKVLMSGNTSNRTSFNDCLKAVKYRVRGSGVYKVSTRRYL